jgi:hypothetical protein
MPDHRLAANRRSYSAWLDQGSATLARIKGKSLEAG